MLICVIRVIARCFLFQNALLALANNTLDAKKVNDSFITRLNHCATNLYDDSLV